MKFFVGLAKFAFLFALDIPAIILRGYVFLQLWQWFVEPLGAPHISIAHALGLAMIAGLCLASVEKKDYGKDTELKWFGQGIIALITSIFVSLMTWGLAAIFHWYM